MNRNTRLLFLVCVAAICGVLLLQLLWIANYYKVNRDRFDKEVNLSLEEAVKTEFNRRCDTLEQNIYQLLLDTTQVLITSKWSDRHQTFVHYVMNRKDTTDNYSFSSRRISQAVAQPLDSVWLQVARQFAATYRSEDLEKHIVFFRTQAIGNRVSQFVDKLHFDTSRLRPVFQEVLAKAGIHELFRFHLGKTALTFTSRPLHDSLRKVYPVITRSFPTWSGDERHAQVSALFTAPVNYLLGKMAGIIIGSVVLLGVVAFALWYLLRIIQREKKLSAIKNDFISNISHELKTPIATVAAAVEAMEGFDVLQNPGRTKRYLHISRLELERLAEMVNKILNIAQYERQEFALKQEPIDMDALIAEITAKYQEVSGDKQVSFHYSNTAGTRTLFADRLHLYNTVSNLVDNAVKYSDEAVDIDINFCRDKQHFILLVRDDGMGIAANDLPYIFDKFYRVPSGNVHKVKGHGLGLSYVKSIMEKHGGWCAVESRPGKGSTFKLGFQA